ncbi:MAG: CDP-diacylglycerol--glycerol-3-phosphate 3-phosphatidyltransferase [Coriobacteriales bacterium]
MASSQVRDNMLTPANIVTVVRILLIPVFVAVLVSPWPALTENLPLWGSLQPWIAAAVFVAISATDAVDGYLARSRNQVTDFGKFLDPLADKILVCAALLGLVELQLLPSWIALVILAREFIVSGLRMLAAAQGLVVAASWYGKVKTVSQIVAIIAFIIKDTVQLQAVGEAFAAGFNLFAWVAMLFAVIMTIVSMIDYFMKCKGLFGFED